jgi:RimJ/RimL family protein N-acetyltransferase
MIETRPATPTDLDAIVEIHTQARTAYYTAGGAPPEEIDSPGFGRVERRAAWGTAITAPDRRVRCAVDEDGRVVGILSMGTPRETTAEMVGVLFQIHVLPTEWRRGIGSRLHADFVSYLQDQDLLIGQLEAWAGNARAQAFYAGHGWRPDGTGRPGPAGLDYLNLRLSFSQREDRIAG